MRSLGGFFIVCITWIFFLQLSVSLLPYHVRGICNGNLLFQEIVEERWFKCTVKKSWSVQLTFEVMGLCGHRADLSINCITFFFLKYDLSVSLLPYRVRGLCNGKSSFSREHWWRDDWHALWSCGGYKDDVQYWIVFLNFDISSSLARETQSCDSKHEITLMCAYQREENSCASVRVLVHDLTVSTVMTWNTF